jgi:hypothetical protein
MLETLGTDTFFLAKSAYGLTDKEMATLKHESIPRSAKTFFSQEDAKNLARRKFIAGASKPGFQLDEVKGELRLFHKALDSNVSRRKNFIPLFAGYIDPSEYRRRY